MQRARASHNGHLYFELVEKGDGDRILGKLDAVLWRRDHQRVRRLLAESGQNIAEGQEIRCRGAIDFYAPAGRLQLIVREVDPLFTLGLLERRRRETLAALTAAGLVARNKALTLDPLPLRVGLISSTGSAAYHDFLSSLGASGFGFQVTVVHAAVQGRDAERQVVIALERLAAAELDCIALVRGGGSRTDLAAFDSRAIAEAVARCPLPVLTGLGHEIDTSITDMVSHTALTTPTKVAEHLVERVVAADGALALCAAAIERRAQDRLLRSLHRLQRIERLAKLGQLRLEAAARRVQQAGRSLDLLSRRRLGEGSRRCRELEQRLLSAAPRRLERGRREPEHRARRLADIAAGRLRELRAVLDGRARLCRGLEPERLLARGYSITRTIAGDLLRSPHEIEAGELVATRLAGGVLTSRVEER